MRKGERLAIDQLAKILLLALGQHDRMFTLVILTQRTHQGSVVFLPGDNALHVNEAFRVAPASMP